MIKKMIIWLGIFSITFTGFIAAFYFGQDSLIPKISEMKGGNSTQSFNSDSTKSARIDSLTVVVEELLKQLRDYVTRTQKMNLLLETQKKEIAQLTAKNDSLRRHIKELKIDSDRIQDLTKTLGAMKIEVLRPLLENLPDEIVQILYDKAKTKEKQKIFNALPPQRAAGILGRMTKHLNPDSENL